MNYILMFFYNCRLFIALVVIINICAFNIILRYS